VRALYLDCFAGIAGDMAAAALLDLAGEETWDELLDVLGRLGLSGGGARVSRVRRDGIAAVDFETAVEEGSPPHRRLPDILALIRGASLGKDVERDAVAMFECLASAEARVHGTGEQDVHFHEVGAADSIQDIVAIAWARSRLCVDRVISSPLPLGRGFVDCAHGRLPVPAPGTVAILEGVPVYQGEIEGETVTPTGAAAVATLADEYGPLPGCRILRTGHGAGKSARSVPNLLRAHLVETAAPVIEGATPTEVVEVETSIDDMNPEAYAPLMDRLFDAGALDVLLCPVQMKKNRPGIMVSALARPDDLHAISSVLLVHTSTFGVRYSRRSRLCLDRTSVTLETAFGQVRAKRGALGDRVMKVVPEYEDCRRLAEEKGVPFLDVYEAAVRAARGD
jgi:uncharacterized protein (TIGR00299 family) protein